MANASTSDWTEADVAMLREMRAAGHAYEKIAARMGRTKGQVIGKAQRIGVPTGDGRARLPPKRVRRAPAPRPQRAAAPPPAPPKPKPRPIGPAGSCMWPTADKATGRITFTCDGGALPGRPYCAAHCARAYDRAWKAAA